MDSGWGAVCALSGEKKVINVMADTCTNTFWLWPGTKTFHIQVLGMTIIYWKICLQVHL